MASKPLKISDTADGSDSTKKKGFTFTVNNELLEPKFNKSVIMEIEDENSPLIKYMEKAVDEHNGLMEKFTVTYFSGKGYLIEAINDVRGTYLVDKSSWQSSWEIRSDKVTITKGISSFIPKDGTEVIVDLSTDRRDDRNRFTFTVKNQLREPFFNNSVPMEIADADTPLIKYMEKAVAERNGLMDKFTVTYVPDSEYSIEKINEARATPSVDNSSWNITTQFGPTPNGISSFKPEDGMNVLLQLEINDPDNN